MTPFTRKLLYAALLYTCIEGLAVNMTYPSKLGFVAKDVLLVLAYASVFATNEGRPFGSLSRLRVPIALFALTQTLYLMVAGESRFPLLARLVGWKMKLLYIPVMFLGYRFIRSVDDFRKMTIVLVAAAIPVSIFGIYLYFAGPAVLRAMGGTYAAVFYSTSGVWRVPGTFTSPGQYGMYLTFNTLLAAGLLISGRITPRVRVMLWVAVGFMVVAMLASGSRGPLVITIAAVGLTIVALGRVGRLVSMSVLLYAVFAIGFFALGAGVSERVDSIASTEHMARFQRTYFGQLFLDRLAEKPMGLGLGSATLGARHFTEFRELVFVESYFGVIAIETGMLGLGAILLVAAAILLNSWRCRAIMARAESAAEWHVMALFSTMVILLMPVGAHLEATPANLYFWLSIGICAKLYDLERWRAAAALSQPTRTL